MQEQIKRPRDKRYSWVRCLQVEQKVRDGPQENKHEDVCTQAERSCGKSRKQALSTLFGIFPELRAVSSHTVGSSSALHREVPCSHNILELPERGTRQN